MLTGKTGQKQAENPEEQAWIYIFIYQKAQNFQEPLETILGIISVDSAKETGCGYSNFHPFICILSSTTEVESRTSREPLSLQYCEINNLGMMYPIHASSIRKKQHSCFCSACMEQTCFQKKKYTQKTTQEDFKTLIMEMY